MAISKRLINRIRKVAAENPGATYREIARRAKTYYNRVKEVLGRKGNAVEGERETAGFRCENGHLVTALPCLTCRDEEAEARKRKAIRVTGEVRTFLFIGWVVSNGVRRKIRGELRVEGGMLEAIAQLKGYVNGVTGSAPAAYDVLLNGEQVRGSI